MVSPVDPLRYESHLPFARPDRRLVQRYRCARRHRVRLVIQQDLREQQAVLHDASAWGVGLLALEPLAPGTVLVFQPPGRPAGSPCVLTATVRHATALPDRTWHLGCSLSQPLADDELRTLL
jgi:hypothetical protein